MRASRYWSLFALQTLGAAALFGVGVPFYRQLLARSQERIAPAEFAQAAACVLVLQVGYWSGLRAFPARALGGHPLAGHLLIFLGRLSFILASSLFSLIYLVRFDELDPPPGGLVLLPLVLFALFCYARELERLGNALLAPPPAP